MEIFQKFEKNEFYIIKYHSIVGISTNNTIVLVWYVMLAITSITLCSSKSIYHSVL